MIFFLNETWDARHAGVCFALILALHLSINKLSKCSDLQDALTTTNLLFFSLIPHLFRSLSGTAGLMPAHSQAFMSTQKGQQKAGGGCKKEEEKKKKKKKKKPRTDERQLQPFQENAVWGHVIEAQCLLLTRRSSSLLRFRAAVTLSLFTTHFSKKKKR